jgi:threonine/homoserine/homoserine lactone efflux protein
MLDNLLLLWAAAIPLMGSPGPANLSLAAVGASYGARAGVWFAAGIAAGTFCVLLLIASGLTAVILSLPAVKPVVVILAAAYILYLAWRTATAPPLAASTPETAAPGFVAAFALAIANPKAFAAIGAVFSGHTLISGQVLADAVAKIIALSGIIVLADLAWLLLGSVISSALTTPRTSRIANIGFALLLVGSVALALWR